MRINYNFLQKRKIYENFSDNLSFKTQNTHLFPLDIKNNKTKRLLKNYRHRVKEFLVL